MPTLSRDRIVRIGEVMLEAGGARPGHASIVAITWPRRTWPGTIRTGS